MFPDKAKMRGKSEFTGVNELLSTFLTPNGNKRTFVQRFQIKDRREYC